MLAVAGDTKVSCGMLSIANVTCVACHIGHLKGSQTQSAQCRCHEGDIITKRLAVVLKLLWTSPEVLHCVS